MSFAHKSRAMNVACKAANSTPVNASRHGTALVPLRVQSTLECPWFYFLITLWNRLRNSDSHRAGLEDLAKDGEIVTALAKRDSLGADNNRSGRWQ
jgi:hypothetical protein